MRRSLKIYHLDFPRVSRSFLESKMCGNCMKFLFVHRRMHQHYIASSIFFRVTKMPPCDLLAITAWEQRYSTQLPEVRINNKNSDFANFPLRISVIFTWRVTGSG